MNNLILNRKIMLRTCAIAVGVALLGGCGSFMRSDFEPPALTIPSHWQHTQVNEQVRVDPWWQQFQQPDLNKLVSQVLSSNNDLALQP
nr:hypothetical protein [Shewanella putrefaciens]